MNVRLIPSDISQEEAVQEVRLAPEEAEADRHFTRTAAWEAACSEARARSAHSANRPSRTQSQGQTCCSRITEKVTPSTVRAWHTTFPSLVKPTSLG